MTILFASHQKDMIEMMEFFLPLFFCLKQEFSVLKKKKESSVSSFPQNTNHPVKMCIFNNAIYLNCCIFGQRSEEVSFLQHITVSHSPPASSCPSLHHLNDDVRRDPVKVLGAVSLRGSADVF